MTDKELITAGFRAELYEVYNDLPLEYSELPERLATALEEHQWRPIDTAPRDRATVVDIWVVSPQGQGFRVPDCHAGQKEHDWVDSKGTWVTGKVFWDKDGHRCLDPDDVSPESARATHWKPVIPPEVEQ